MSTEVPFVLPDEGQEYFRDILENNYEEARQRALSLIENATMNENGCRVTGTQAPRKVRFQGRQLYAYRFVFCVLNRHAAAGIEIVRHRCNNRTCVNPEHLELGEAADNHADHLNFQGNGVDYRLL